MKQSEVYWATIGRFTIRGMLVGAVLGGIYGTILVPILGTVFGVFDGAIVGYPLGTLNGLVMITLTVFTADGPRLLKAPQSLGLYCAAFTFVVGALGFSILHQGSSSYLIFIIIPALIAAAGSYFTAQSIALINRNNIEKPKNKPKHDLLPSDSPAGSDYTSE